MMNFLLYNWIKWILLNLLKKNWLLEQTIIQLLMYNQEHPNFIIKNQFKN